VIAKEEKLSMVNVLLHVGRDLWALMVLVARMK
jgi:hypothetical protein